MHVLTDAFAENMRRWWSGPSTSALMNMMIRRAAVGAVGSRVESEHNQKQCHINCALCFSVPHEVSCAADSSIACLVWGNLGGAGDGGGKGKRACEDQSKCQPLSANSWDCNLERNVPDPALESYKVAMIGY